jgi:hypothetical protein
MVQASKEISNYLKLNSVIVVGGTDTLPYWSMQVNALTQVIVPNRTMTAAPHMFQSSTVRLNNQTYTRGSVQTDANTLVPIPAFLAITLNGTLV